MKKPIAPCRGCERRTIECHTVYEEYKEFTEAIRAYKVANRSTEIQNYIRGRIYYGTTKKAHK